MHVLGSLPLATSTADADAVDNVTLLGLVSETAGLVGARGAACAVDDLKLAKLSMHSQQCSTSTSIETESQDVHTSQHCRNVSRVLCPSTIVVEYVRERASRSASCPTASSSEVLRHLRRISYERAIAVFGVRLHLRAPICGIVSIESTRFSNIGGTYLDCWLVDCRRCRA